MQQRLAKLFTHLLSLAGLAVALLLGPIIGALGGAVAGLGLGGQQPARSVLPGPGAWFAAELHSRVRGCTGSSLLAGLVALPAGLAVGLVAGPLWLNFLGVPTASWAGESLAEHVLGAVS